MRRKYGMVMIDEDEELDIYIYSQAYCGKCKSVHSVDWQGEDHDREETYFCRECSKPGKLYTNIKWREIPPIDKADLYEV